MNQSPGSDTRKQRLEVLVGQWETTITMLNEDGSEGESSKARDAYSWSANGHFLMHDVDAQMSGNRAQSFEIIALDPTGDGYVTRSYDADGSINDFTAERIGTSWRITGEKQRFAGEFSEDGEVLSGRWEQHQDGRWIPIIKVVLHKQSER